MILWANLGIDGPAPAGHALARVRELLARGGDDIRIQTEANANLAVLQTMVGDFVHARESAAAARDMAELSSIYWLIAISRYSLAYVEWHAGGRDLALSHWRETLEMWLEHEDVEGIPRTAAVLADALADEGQVEEALRMATLAEETSKGNERFADIIARGARARALAAPGDAKAALAIAEAAVKSVNGREEPILTASILAVLASVLGRLGQFDDARAAACKAMRLARAKGHRPMARRMLRIARGYATSA